MPIKRSDLKKKKKKISCELARQNAALLLQRYEDQAYLPDNPGDPGPWPG